jgi:hypothetical protein
MSGAGARDRYACRCAKAPKSFLRGFRRVFDKAGPHKLLRHLLPLSAVTPFSFDPTRFDAAIVDLDGTMVDTLGDFAEALNRMLRDLSLPPVAPDAIELMVGKGSEHLIHSALVHVLTPAEGPRGCAGHGARAVRRAWERYQHHYLAINGQHSAVYAGVAEGLQALRARGVRLACLTNKPGSFAGRCWRRRGSTASSSWCSAATPSSARSPTRCRC